MFLFLDLLEEKIFYIDRNQPIQFQFYLSSFSRPSNEKYTHRNVDFFDVPSLVKQRRAKIADPDQRHADMRQTFIPEKTVIIHRNRPISRIRINMTTFS